MRIAVHFFQTHKIGYMRMNDIQYMASADYITGKNKTKQKNKTTGFVVFQPEANEDSTNVVESDVGAVDL